MCPSEEKTVGRAGDVETEIKIMDEALARLGAVLDKLDVRLTPVLRSAALQGQQGATPEEVRVPLAETIRQQRYAVERASSLVGGLLDRLQI